MPSKTDPTSSTPGQAAFAATRWTMVLAAADTSPGSRSRRALEELAQAYWFPLYAFLRRQGHSAHDSEDLVQAFFARLIENRTLAAADQSRGRFRSFLLASLKHFVADEWDKATTLKRGGGKLTIALDGLDAEARYRLEPVDDMTPERVFTRRWALAVTDQAMVRLQREYADKGQSDLFDALKPTVAIGRQAQSHAASAKRLGMTEGAVKVAAHRLRRRYRELLRDEIGQTVSGHEEVDAELRDLMDSL